MKAVRTELMARVVDPNTSDSMRIQMFSKIKLVAPEMKKQKKTRFLTENIFQARSARPNSSKVGIME